jgi:hypothetical protein
MSTPKTIPEYLEQLRAALKDADAAVVQDALYDAEEYLRSELATRPNADETQLLAEMATTYGKPEEVAEIYLEREVQVSAAFRSPLNTDALERPSSSGVAAIAASQPRVSFWAKFFGVVIDPMAYSALFYMLLSLATGIFYFTWTITGISMSLGLGALIIGVPFAILFIGTIWVLSLVEGRLIETLLGVRMPRRPSYTDKSRSIWQAIKDVLSDARTWATLFYFLLMLPLGVIYFTVAITSLSVSVALAFSPLVQFVHSDVVLFQFGSWSLMDHPWLTLPACALGIFGMLLSLHLARAIGGWHAQFAKHLLVKVGE